MWGIWANFKVISKSLLLWIYIKMRNSVIRPKRRDISEATVNNIFLMTGTIAGLNIQKKKISS